MPCRNRPAILPEVKNRWNLRADPLIGFARVDFFIAESSGDYVQDVFNGFSSVDVGFVAAIGIEFFRYVFVEFEFNPTFNDSFTSVNLNVNNQLFTFNLGLRLAKK